MNGTILVVICISIRPILVQWPVRQPTSPVPYMSYNILTAADGVKYIFIMNYILPQVHSYLLQMLHLWLCQHKRTPARHHITRTRQALQYETGNDWHEKKVDIL